MAVFILETDSVSSAASSIHSLEGDMTALADEVNSFDTSNDEGFPFDSAKGVIAGNMEACSIKIANTSNLMEGVVEAHTNLQNSLISPSGGEDGGSNSNSNGSNVSNSYGGPGGSSFGPGGSFAGGAASMVSSTPTDTSGGSSSQARVAEEGPVDIKDKIDKLGYATFSTDDLSQETKDILEHEDFHYEDGYAKLGDYYLITCDKSIGKVGDVIQFTMKDGTVVQCIVAVNTVGEKFKNTINFLVDKDNMENIKPLDLVKAFDTDLQKLENLGDCRKVLGIDLPVRVSKVATGAVDWAISIANDNRFGYVSGGMGNGGYDCTQFIHAAYEAAGISLPNKGYVNQTNIVDYYTKNGFEWHPGTPNVDDLLPGDVLVNQQRHAEMYIGDGKKIGAHNNYDGASGDSSGSEISVNAYSNFPWDGYLRYVGTAKI